MNNFYHCSYGKNVYLKHNDSHPYFIFPKYCKLILSALPSRRLAGESKAVLSAGFHSPGSNAVTGRWWQEENVLSWLAAHYVVINKDKNKEHSGEGLLIFIDLKKKQWAESVSGTNREEGDDELSWRGGESPGSHPDQ